MLFFLITERRIIIWWYLIANYLQKYLQPTAVCVLSCSMYCLFAFQIRLMESSAPGGSSSSFRPPVHQPWKRNTTTRLAQEQQHPTCPSSKWDGETFRKILRQAAEKEMEQRRSLILHAELSKEVKMQNYIRVSRCCCDYDEQVEYY